MSTSAYQVYKPMYWAATVCILAAGLYMVYWSKKDLADYPRATGQITSILQKHPDFPLRAGPKDRYIQVAGFDKAFEVYLGGESGDLLPEFQSIGELKAGDSVTVFYQDNPPYIQSNGEEEKIIFFTQQIERAGTPHYIRGDMNLYLGNILIIGAGLIAAFLFLYKGK